MHRFVTRFVPTVLMAAIAAAAVFAQQKEITIGGTCRMGTDEHAVVPEKWGVNAS